MAAVLDYGTNEYSNSNILITQSFPKLAYLLYSSILLSLLFPAYRIILKDYSAFLALGPGGTPSTFVGYLRVTYLRLFTLRDPFQPPSLAQPMYPQWGYLRNLLRRSGPRPAVAGIAPHRQLNQKPGPRLHHALRAAFHDLAAGFPSLIRKGNSCFEKHGLALFLSACAHEQPTDAPHPAASHLNPTCQDTGEICHLHATVSFSCFFLPSRLSVLLRQTSSRWVPPSVVQHFTAPMPTPTPNSLPGLITLKTPALLSDVQSISL